MSADGAIGALASTTQDSGSGVRAPAVDWDALLAADRRHVWHPYAPLPAATPPLPVVSASGVRLRLGDGRELIDGMASWWCAIHGYRHPEMDAAIRGQLERMAHVMFGGLTHEPAIRLAQRLIALTPEPLEHVFIAIFGCGPVGLGAVLAAADRGCAPIFVVDADTDRLLRACELGATHVIDPSTDHPIEAIRSVRSRGVRYAITCDGERIPAGCLAHFGQQVGPVAQTAA